jgi:hypothetical protein
MASIVLWLLLLIDADEFLAQDTDFLVSLGEFVNFAGKFLQPVLQNFVGDFFFIEGDHFLDGADTFFQVLAHGEQFVDHDGRARKRLQDA